MKSYNPNIYEGIHTVKVTLQQWDYVGHLIYEMGGNCKGKTILDFDFYDMDIDSIIQNDCQLMLDEYFDIFECKLKNENGDTMDFECDASEMNDMIVAIEIIDYRKE